MWLNIIEGLRSAFASIRAHKLRSFLTSLGIIIGVASVIAVVSVIQGLSASITDQFQGLGSNTITIVPYTPREKRLQGIQTKLVHADLLAIEERVTGIADITPSSQLPATQIRVGDKTATVMQVIGTVPSYLTLYEIYPRVGRFVVASDEATRRPVIVLGEEARKNLELPEDPVGEFVQIYGEWFRVIGVLEARGELLGFSQDDFVIMPYSTARRIQGPASEPSIVIQLKIPDLTQVSRVQDQIRRLLRRNHGLAPDDDDDFRVQTPEQLLETFNAIAGTITAVSGGIVGISLLVGGIGIMNIMLVSVTERTREIGILKALGATRGDILLQFLIEAIALCLLGGLIGLALGYGLGALVATMLPGFPPASVPVWAIALGLGFSVAVGVVFGILPAAKAANLDPIDALRYE